MKLLDLQSNEQFMKKLADAKTPEEIRSLLNEYDVELSDEEIRAALAEADKELPEDELENVSGGVVGEILGGVAVLCFLIGLARGSRCKR